MSDKRPSNKLFILSTNPEVNLVLNNDFTRLKEYTEVQCAHLNKLTEIGVALSSLKDLDKLLEMIVDQARVFTNSDGGTLYLVSEDEERLEYSIAQNETLNMRRGGTSGVPITWPAVLLKINGEPNVQNVSAYSAVSGEVVNIPDVYDYEGFNFEGMKKADEANRYRSKSMLVIPMRNHEDEIIGVLQLINAREPDFGEIVAFAPELAFLTEALASQAAISITNTRLIQDVQNLFDSFIKTIASAIDEKSHYTGNHIERVSNLTMEIAARINDTDEGFFADTNFTEDEMEELRLAAWLHDTGKITTPEYIVDKRTKLETIFDREELVRIRFELAISNIRLKLARKLLKKDTSNVRTDEIKEIITRSEEMCQKLSEDFLFIKSSNLTSEWVPYEKIERLNSIAEMEVDTTIGPEHLLSENELLNLSIRNRNLMPEEREIINNHVTVTMKMLEKLPFPKKWKNVPSIAGAHHEQLCGKGYPLGLKDDEIPLQARILALADIFEALTAKDRPYNQETKKMSRVVEILGFEVNDRHLDGDVVQFFLDRKMHIEYGKEHMLPSQLDVE